jgi:23S rRNA G2445 N2-methylase RlmL
MKYKYYAAFVPGMRDIVLEIIANRLSDIKILKLLEGAVIFETDCIYDQLNLYCFNNIFTVIDIFENENPVRAVETHIERILEAGPGQDLEQGTFPEFNKNTKGSISFKVVTTHDNHPIRIVENLKNNIEEFILNATHLRINHNKPEVEYWFIFRNEGFSVFMKRITRRKPSKKNRHEDELPSHLSYMLCYLARLQAKDVVLDPFCGYGSISVQILKHFSINRLYMSDIENDVIETVKNIISQMVMRRCCINQTDICDIFSILPEQSVDKIITDLPWGLYEPLDDIRQFYIDITGIFNKLLKPGGVIVLLTAKEEELIDALSLIGELTVENVIPILVSREKAGVFRIVKALPPEI